MRPGAEPRLAPDRETSTPCLVCFRATSWYTEYSAAGVRPLCTDCYSAWAKTPVGRIASEPAAGPELPSHRAATEVWVARRRGGA